MHGLLGRKGTVGLDIHGKFFQVRPLTDAGWFDVVTDFDDRSVDRIDVDEPRLVLFLVPLLRRNVADSFSTVSCISTLAPFSRFMSSRSGFKTSMSEEVLISAAVTVFGPLASIVITSGSLLCFRSRRSFMLSEISMTVSRTPLMVVYSC